MAWATEPHLQQQLLRVTPGQDGAMVQWNKWLKFAHAYVRALIFEESTDQAILLQRAAHAMGLADHLMDLILTKKLLGHGLQHQAIDVLIASFRAMDLKPIPADLMLGFESITDQVGLPQWTKLVSSMREIDVRVHLRKIVCMHS
jgi:hypothetical protein